MKRVVFVVAPLNFRDEELFYTKEELEKAKVECAVASTQVGTCTGKLGGKINATLNVSQVNASNFDGVVFIGGNGVLEHKLHENKHVLQLARDFEAQKKVISAICIAPRILINANVINSRTATTFPDDENIRGINEQGTYAETSVEVDGRLITANGPSSARKFGKQIAAALRV